jgi:hypothetical protein
MQTELYYMSGPVKFQVLGATRLLALALCALASTAARADDNEDLQALAMLTGTNYTAQRNFLLEEHPSPYGIASATQYSWGAGLAAYILDAWQTNTSDFTNWEGSPIVLDEAGGEVRLEMVSPDASGQTFLVEQVWKTAPTAEVAHDSLTSLLNLPLVGPLPLWNAVYLSAPAGPPPGLPPSGGPLEQIAIHALAGGADLAVPRDTVADALTNTAVSNAVKMAALTGLALGMPADATSLLLATETSWSSNAALLAAAFGALAAQTNSGGRNPLYAVAQDTNRPAAVRMTAISAFTADPLPGEITILQGILSNGVTAAMTNQIDNALEIYDLLDVPP